MSRKEIVGKNYTIAFGVDHITGAFVQLWDTSLFPIDEQDCAFLVVDSTGIRVADEAGVNLTVRMARYLNEVEERFKQFKKYHPDQRPNITENEVIDVAKIAGGFLDISKEVHEIFGGDI